MTRRVYVWLFLAGLAVNLTVTSFQISAGYMDADYYYSGGIRLAERQGFSELSIWNYLNDPRALPAPSHGYWYPLASILAAGGMLVGGTTSYAWARTGFVFMGALISPLTSALAFRLTPRFDLALAAGLLALLPSFFTAFIPVTDNFGIYMVLGAAFFLLLDGRATSASGWSRILLAGLCAGLMNLARSDGLLWAAAGAVFIALQSRDAASHSAGTIRETERADPAHRAGALAQVAWFLGGFLLVMLPWFARNYVAWGSLLAPGGRRVLMLHTYADTFAFPASRLTLGYLLSAGWGELIETRVAALIANLNASGTLLINTFLLPFALIGLWALRRVTIVQVGLLIWLALLGAMSLLFPFAGPRGSFTHAAAGLYSLVCASIVAGIGVGLEWAKRRGWTALTERTNLVLFGVVILNSLFSIYLAYSRIVTLDWDRFQRVYTQVEARVAQDGASPDTPIVVVDPPAYFTANRRPALVLPYENTDAVLALADKFGAGYLLLEKEYLRTASLRQLYNSGESDRSFEFIGQVEDAKIYRIER